MQRAIIISKGKVQKVGYRDFVQDCARELDITGYVENLEDGTVKIVCEGKKEKIKVFVSNIKVKRDFIDVTEIIESYGDPTGEFSFFKIKYGDMQEELGERFGAAILYLSATNQKIDAGFNMLGGKQDKTLSKQDQMLDKQDQMLDKQDKMLDKQDQMLDKQDTTIEILKSVKCDTSEIKGSLSDLMGRYHRETLDLKDKYEQLREDVDAIKSKIGYQ